MLTPRRFVGCRGMVIGGGSVSGRGKLDRFEGGKLVDRAGEERRAEGECFAEALSRS